jgi:hypothetical protein
MKITKSYICKKIISIPGKKGNFENLLIKIIVAFLGKW